MILLWILILNSATRARIKARGLLGFGIIIYKILKGHIDPLIWCCHPTSVSGATALLVQCRKFYVQYSSEEILILRLVGRTQPESRGLSKPLLVSRSILPSLDLILRPILQINLSLSGYWDQRFYVILHVHLGF